MFSIFNLVFGNHEFPLILFNLPHALQDITFKVSCIFHQMLSDILFIECQFFPLNHSIDGKLANYIPSLTSDLIVFDAEMLENHRILDLIIDIVTIPRGWLPFLTMNNYTRLKAKLSEHMPIFH